jgi:hypothetical protein
MHPALVRYADPPRDRLRYVALGAAVGSIALALLSLAAGM